MKTPWRVVFAVLVLVALGLLIDKRLQTTDGLSQSSWEENGMNFPLPEREQSFSHAPKGVFSDNLVEKPDRYIVTVNTPGADSASVDVKLEGRQLTILVKTSHTGNRTDDDNGRYSYQKRSMGEFNRVLTLPGPVNEDKMKSEYKDGVLTVTIPKK